MANSRNEQEKIRRRHQYPTRYQYGPGAPTAAETERDEREGFFGQLPFQEAEQILAQEALNVQDASNLSGVVHSYAAAVKQLWVIANARGKGTDWVNHHPVAQAFADKCAHLAGVQEITSEAIHAIRLCHKIKDGVVGAYP